MAQFPYPKTGTVQKLGGAVIAENVPVDIWALGSHRQTSAGETYDWEGLAPASAGASLVGTNRQFVIGDDTWRIISVVVLDDPLSHVELRLLKLGATGGRHG